MEQMYAITTDQASVAIQLFIHIFGANFVCIVVYYVLNQVRESHLEKAVHSKVMEQLAHTDFLTGLFNRRHIMDKLTKQIDSYTPSTHSLSLILCDIDHFKKVNDQFGHATGDDVLKQVSIKLSTTLRKGQTIGRWGGEEFIIVLENTRQSEARLIAEKMRETIATTSFPKVKRVTISCGVSEFSRPKTVDTFINEADIALYQAKENGRNQVVEHQFFRRTSEQS